MTLHQARLDSSGRAHFEDLYRRVPAAFVPPSTASSARLVFRTEGESTLIEPFLGSASLAALVSVRKKRGDAMALLSALVACGFFLADSVDLLFRDERSTSTPAPADVSFEALSALHTLEAGRHRIVAHPMWFRFQRAEAKLLTPLALPSGERATHYFQEHWVRAVDLRVARLVVERQITEDAAKVVTLGETLPSDPPTLPIYQGGNVARGGRIFFSDAKRS